MKIRNIKHKGLRRLYEDNSTSGLPAAVVDKVRKILSFLEVMQSADELHVLTLWKAHQWPDGPRRGLWALHVTKNWRITFFIDAAGIEIIDLNYEDYH